jgi:hypothetical protein
MKICWICLWHMKFSSFSMNRKIGVYNIKNHNRSVQQIGRPCTKFSYLNDILEFYNSFKDDNRIQFRGRVNMNVKPIKQYLV